MNITNMSILLYISTAINSEIIASNHQPLYELAEFAAKVYHKFCPEGKTTLIVHQAYDLTPDYFMRILGKTYFNMSLYTYNLKMGPTAGGYYDGVRADLTIIFINGNRLNGKLIFVDVVLKIPSFSMFSKLLIVQTGTVKEGKWISKIFQFIWQYKIMRAFLVFWDDGLKIFTFNPFLRNYSIDASDWSDKNLNLKLEFELFDLNGYPLRVFLWNHASYKDRVQVKFNPNNGIEYVGYDGKLLTQVRNILNVTLNITRDSQSQISNQYNENKSSVSYSMLNHKFLEDNDFDILFTAIRAKGQVGVDHLFLHERDDYVIVVPKGEKIPDYLYIFMTVPLRLQIFSGLVMWGSMFLLYYIRKYYKCKNGGVVDVWLDIFRHALVLPLPKYNENNPEKILLNSFIMFYMIFISILNSSMISSLVVQKYIPDINTIDDLVKTNLTIWTSTYELGLVSQNLQGNDRRLLKNLREQPMYSLQSMMSTQNNSGFLTRFERAREFVKFSKKYGKIRYNIMSEHPVPNAQSYLMPKGHPYLEEIQWIIHKVHESGLYYEWRKTNYGKENISIGADVETHFEDQSKFLRLVHLQTVFYMHLITLLAAFIILLIEICVKKYKK